MAVPTGDMDPTAAEEEVKAAMLFFEDLSDLGVVSLAVAQSPPAARGPDGRKRLVDYLILYRRVRALVDKS